MNLLLNLLKLLKISILAQYLESLYLIPTVNMDNPSNINPGFALLRPRYRPSSPHPFPKETRRQVHFPPLDEQPAADPNHNTAVNSSITDVSGNSTATAATPKWEQDEYEVTDENNNSENEEDDNPKLAPVPDQFKDSDDKVTLLSESASPTLSLMSSAGATGNPSWDNVTEKTWSPVKKPLRPAYKNLTPSQYLNVKKKPTMIAIGSQCSHCSSSDSYQHSRGSSRATSRGSNVSSQNYAQLESVLSELRQKRVVFDRSTAIRALKARILKGEKVSHDEIIAIKQLSLPLHQKHMGWRLPWSMDLYCDKGLVYIPTPNSPPPEKGNSFGTIEDLRIYRDDMNHEERYGRRRYILNLAGYKDEDITLYLEGKNKLVVRALKEVNREPVITTETILLPPDLTADNLRIVRKPSGTTIIEESWRF